MNRKVQENSGNLFAFNNDAGLADDVKRVIENEEAILELCAKEPVVYNDAFLLKTEANLLNLAYAYNKIMSLSNSRTRILAHQVESTHRIVEALNHRFLIADEVGLGKTVEAGLVIKELIYRYKYKRVLIACPASLLCQWQSEMHSKFNEDFIIMDRKVLKQASRHPSGNPWLAHDKIICSLDFIKNSAFHDDLSNCKWDTVIFDEAHRLRRDKNKSTLTYNVAEIIAERCKSLLLLSATPFRGKLEELYFLLALLDRNILGPFNTFYNEYCMENSDTSVLKEKLASILIRRTKRDVGGFTVRHAKTIKFDLYPVERLLYDETTEYVVKEFNRAMQVENRAVGFVMTVFQKLLDSSAYALKVALKNRVERLEGMVNNAEFDSSLIEQSNELVEGCFDEDESEDVNSYVTLSIEKTISELKEEILTIKRLIDIAEKIERDKKGEKLVELINSLSKKGNKKFLIFTQFRTTQDYLKEILSDYKVDIFNGSMSLDEKEVSIINFKQDTEILIATEAGGEGRNMQFCNILINYDLPWSPLKIEQRIGRLHRFGQKKDVFIYNFSTKDTVADRVLEVLTHKLQLFEDSIGPPDVMLGQVEDELKLNKLFMEMASGKKNRTDISSEIDDRLNYARENYEKLSDLSVTNKMDFNYDEYYKITLKERSFSNCRIERFVNKLQSASGFPDTLIGPKHGRNKLYPIRQKEDSGDKKNLYGTFQSEIALDNDNIEFLAFGHPIVNQLISHCVSDNYHGATGIKIVRYDQSFSGMLFNYIVTFKSVETTRELVPVIVELDGQLDDFSLDELEYELVEQDLFEELDIPLNEHGVQSIIDNVQAYSFKARERLYNKIERKITDKCESLDIYIDPEIEKIKESYDKRLAELEEKRDLQESKMKWYGSDMKSALTRTNNAILRAKREREAMLEKYSSYTGIKYEIRLLNAGIIAAQ